MSVKQNAVSPQRGGGLEQGGRCNKLNTPFKIFFKKYKSDLSNTLYCVSLIIVYLRSRYYKTRALTL